MTTSTGYRIAFDVGGTFTDVVLESPDGQLITDKVLTTYPDPSEGCLRGLDTITSRAGTDFSQIVEAVHGTTLGSNVVIERKGVGIGLLTTEGFRDVLHLGRQKRYQIYDLQLEKPDPLVDRDAVYTVSERVLANGSVHRPLSDADVRAVAAEIDGAGITSLAVCLLHSYANPAHERRIAEVFAEVAPHVVLSLSSDVSPKFREFERTSTTVANAYLMNSVRAYLTKLRTELANRGFAGELFIMQSSGGLGTAEAMTRFPVRMIESGPAAGALMASKFGELADSAQVVAFDMGGTTAKLALVVDGKPAMVSQFELHKIGHASGSGIPMNVHSLDLAEIGSGGGSIARSELGTIKVGPDSAGSQPGPASYGLGGTEPTVTDANLVLGYLNPGNFAGGSFSLNVEAARTAIRERVAEPLGMSVEEAAWGVHRMVNLSMELTTRVVSIERGHDPRGLALVATGGSGPVHACRLAQELGLPKVVVPAEAGVASALGMLAAEIKYDIDRTRLSDFSAEQLPAVDAVLAEMSAEVETFMQSATGRPPARIVREVEMRYAGQGFELSVELPDGPLTEPGAVEDLRKRFEAEYEQRYGFANPEAALEATTWKLTSYGERRPLEIPRRPEGDTSATPAAQRPAYFPELGGYTDTNVYRRDTLSAGSTFTGPAIVEDSGSTAVVPPDCTAHIDPYGNLVVTLNGND
jgi:N-methylhydantoinase A/oxoprolinase/acetone carboxylase beta subunit